MKYTPVFYRENLQYKSGEGITRRRQHNNDYLTHYYCSQMSCEHVFIIQEKILFSPFSIDNQGWVSTQRENQDF